MQQSTVEINQEAIMELHTVQVVQPVPSLKLDTSTTAVVSPVRTANMAHSSFQNQTPTPQIYSNANSSASGSSHLNIPPNTPSTSASAVPNQLNTSRNVPLVSITVAVDQLSAPTQTQCITSARSGLKSNGLITPSLSIGSFISIQPIAPVGPTTHISSCKRRGSSSPANSPHKHGKVGPKKRRTMHLSPAKVFRHERGQPAASRQPNTDLKHFLELESESECKARLFKEVFACFLQKSTVSIPDSGQLLKPLREFILPTPAQLADNDPSRIYYMELLDENADSEETMAQVAEMLIERVWSDSHNWVILIGDGKTYEHLQRVKRLYGSTLDKLLIFPGDWHVFKTFQPVLIKAYYHVGLKDIAKASGYRAETLKSLEKFSHFKRTHPF